MNTSISLTFDAKTAEEFERAVAALASLNPSVAPIVTVSAPTERDPRVSWFMANYKDARGIPYPLVKYKRSANGRNRGLTELQDLYLRSQTGDALAVQAFAESDLPPPDMPSEDGSTVETVDTPPVDPVALVKQSEELPEGSMF